MSDRAAAPDGLACEWTVSGMDCGSCAAKVRGAVERLPGVSAGGDLAHNAALPMPMVSVVQAMAGGQLAASGALMGLLAGGH